MLAGMDPTGSPRAEDLTSPLGPVQHLPAPQLVLHRQLSVLSPSPPPSYYFRWHRFEDIAPRDTILLGLVPSRSAKLNHKLRIEGREIDLDSHNILLVHVGWVTTGTIQPILRFVH
ncbi:uncharacterized protein BXZ73DRAFT_99348 [Epithele typhae]|uniref:uncharacterized protein n=1 Tax=Epithele typhae TaxID=378194 RepID=UPI0020088ECE|nr:uncharacterized protein BXZ73DRAFT_99348 [Epithele typhae]KAH9939714.1 hypothetical protein BXZ73DRAFT_99348 [Epithele typhae]